MVEIITLLTNYLNLTIEPQINEYHSNFSYMLQMVESDQTDLFANIFTNTTKRAEKFGFTEELYFVSVFNSQQLSTLDF